MPMVPTAWVMARPATRTACSGWAAHTGHDRTRRPHGGVVRAQPDAPAWGRLPRPQGRDGGLRRASGRARLAVGAHRKPAGPNWSQEGLGTWPGRPLAPGGSRQAMPHHLTDLGAAGAGGGRHRRHPGLIARPYGIPWPGATFSAVADINRGGQWCDAVRHLHRHVTTGPRSPAGHRPSRNGSRRWSSSHRRPGGGPPRLRGPASTATTGRRRPATTMPRLDRRTHPPHHPLHGHHTDHHQLPVKIAEDYAMLAVSHSLHQLRQPLANLLG